MIKVLIDFFVTSKLLVNRILGWGAFSLFYRTSLPCISKHKKNSWNHVSICVVFFNLFLYSIGVEVISFSNILIFVCTIQIYLDRYATRLRLFLKSYRKYSLLCRSHELRVLETISFVFPSLSSQFFD